MSLLLRLAVFTGMLLSLVTAQVGPNIILPANNASVSLGKKLDITYSYPNLGPGQYTVDVSLWQDASAQQLIQNLLTGVSVPEGISNGTSNVFNTNATISVQIPQGLNDTFFLTILQHVKTQNGITPDVRSFPLMLHSAGATHLPQSMTVLLSIALCILGYYMM